MDLSGAEADGEQPHMHALANREGRWCIVGRGQTVLVYCNLIIFCSKFRECLLQQRKVLFCTLEGNNAVDEFERKSGVNVEDNGVKRRDAS